MQAALQWLARHQGPDGGWDAENFSGHCKGQRCDGTGHHEINVGLTGLVLLAFLGAGVTPGSADRYTDTVTGAEIGLASSVARGLDFLLKAQASDGLFGTKGRGKMMYNHALATQAIAEGHGLTGAPAYKSAARRGVKFLINAKNPYKAWRYEPRDGENDTSVTGWCVMALKSAQAVGIDVDRESLEQACSLLDEVTEKTSGKCGYQRLEDAGVKVVVQGQNEDYANHESLTAVGMVCRAFIRHDPADPLLGLGARLLVQDLPEWSKEKKTNDYYYWYCGTLALFQVAGPGSGGEAKSWEVWNHALQRALLGHQREHADGCAQGSWDADDRWGFEGGRVYATALNALTLETYYRYPGAFADVKRASVPAATSPAATSAARTSSASVMVNQGRNLEASGLMEAAARRYWEVRRACPGSESAQEAQHRLEELRGK